MPQLNRVDTDKSATHEVKNGLDTLQIDPHCGLLSPLYHTISILSRGPYGCRYYFVRSGYTSISYGMLRYAALEGDYWHSEADVGNNAYLSYFDDEDAYLDEASNRNSGFSLRCLSTV